MYSPLFFYPIANAELGSQEAIFHILMKKQLRLLTFVLITLVSVGNFYASGAYYDFEADGVCYEITSDYRQEVITTSRTYTITGDSYSGDVVVPTQVEYLGKTYTVIGIGPKTFASCKNMTSVILPGKRLFIRLD